MLRVFGYLKAFSKGRTVFDPSPPELSNFTFANHDWDNLYVGSEEAIDPDQPKPLNEKELDILLFVDASNGSDKDTMKSVTAYHVLLGQTVVQTYSKRQNTIETSTYGSELVASKIAVEAALAMRQKLRMLGIKVSKPTTILCDNQSVVYNMTLPSSTLKKKHHLLSWNKCREAVAIEAVRFAHIGSKWNQADLGTKAVGPVDCYRLLRAPMFGKLNTGVDEIQE